MSSYCPQMFYMTLNGANYYYAQSCDSCSYVCIALNETPNCGGCCKPFCGCTEACHELVTNADHPFVSLLKNEMMPTIPVRGVSIPRPVTDLDPIVKHSTGIWIDTQDFVTFVDGAGAAQCKLRLISVRIDAGGGNWRLMYVGQELHPDLPVSANQVKKALPSSGKYHRVKYLSDGDNRKFDVITFRDIA